MTARKGGSAAPAPPAERWSPLGASTTEAVLVAAAPGVEAWELPFMTQLDLRLVPDAGAMSAAQGALGVSIPTIPNRVETGRDARAIWLGPDEWLIVGPAVTAGPPAAEAAPAAETAPAAAAPGKVAAGGRVPGAKRSAGGGRTITEAGVGAAVRRAGGTVVDVSAQRTILRLSGPRAAEILAHGCSIDLHPRSFDVGACAQTLLARVDVILERQGIEEFAVFVRASFASYLLEWLRDAMGIRNALVAAPPKGCGTPSKTGAPTKASPKRPTVRPASKSRAG